MTTNIQEMLDRAFEAGRMAERKMVEIIRGHDIEQKIQGAATTIGQPIGNGPTPLRRGRHAATPATAAPKAPKAPTVARGVKAAPKTRTKGVKTAIVNLIASGPTTVEKIIDHTGFKKNSIVSTLMDLKKKGLAMQDGKAWIGLTGAGSGNSEQGDWPSSVA